MLKPYNKLFSVPTLVGGWDSVVDIATRYGSDGQFRWERDFPYPSRLDLRSTQSPVQGVPGLFAGEKAAGAWP